MVYVFRWWTKFCFKYNWVSVKMFAAFVCYLVTFAQLTQKKKKKSTGALIQIKQYIKA